MKCRELVSVAELSTADRAAFTGAILALKVAPSKIAAAATAVTAGGGAPNRYDDYVWMHSTVGSGAHFGPAFGPWHREFLRQFEFDLRQVSGRPDIVIPYWDWTTGATGQPNWPFTDDLLGPLGNTAGLVTTGPFSNPATWRMNIRRRVPRLDRLAQVADTSLQLRRRPATMSPGVDVSLPTVNNARTAMAMTSPYDASPYNELNSGFTNAQINALVNGWVSASFRKFLEWVLHNGTHTWVGGQDDWPSGATPTFIAGPMSIPAVAVNDPVFWLHHCNVDRLWTTWQQRQPPGTYVPTTGADAGHNRTNQMVHFEATNAGNFNAALKSTPADVVDSRGQLDIWYKSDLPLITPVTPSVNFGDVPANLTTDWPVKFDVRTCRRVKFRVTAVGGANFSAPATQGDVIADHHHDRDPVRTQVFLEFHALGTGGVVQPGTATIAAFIDDTEGYFGTAGAEYQVGTFPITMSARPVAAPRAAVTFVLDRSGSMSESVGPAGTKYDLLRSSLRVVAALMRTDDAIGLVSYDDLVATITPTMPPLGTVSPPGAGRLAVENAITSGGLVPRGATGIGRGMIAGAALLGTVQTDASYPIKAMVVMTDGNENVTPNVTDPTVTSAIAWFSDHVYAIGLGDEANVSTTTLGAIARYQLITGNITTTERQFLLTKYFLQILATITGSAIVVDPQGELRPGDEHRIPFDIGDSDVSMDVVAICPVAPLLDLTLEAPDGTVIHAGSGPNVELQIDGGDEFYRVRLPAIAADGAGTHAGRWTAVLRIGEPRKTNTAVALRRKDPGRQKLDWQVLADIDRKALAAVAERGALPYQVFVQSYSNLRMEVEVRQDGYLPGTKLTLFAGLQEYRQPVASGARVAVEVTEPDGGEVLVSLAEVAPGRFEGAHMTSRKGVYQYRFRASGVTRGGRPFQREDTRTAAVNARLAPGGDLATPTAVDDGSQDRRRWCALVTCLLHEPSIARALEKHEVDPREIEACLKRYCVAARATHAVTDAPTEEAPMSEEIERLREELRGLRAEFKQSAAFDSAHWDELLVAAPVANEVVCAPRLVAAEDPAHAAHHDSPLPALIIDDDGTTRVFRPGGGHGDHGGHGGLPGPGEPDSDAGHDHGRDDRSGHDHSGSPKKK